ncbi:hypothetical protein [Chromobacterium violaceum]|uniref:Uncharacterized protein n=1 Tax=Chromobacterium violaceum TaxID=536 RepID=A0AAX2MEC7_CHRVL|nr:hypothetical protein [Chromobacterium violaceum]ATP30331.1 hypothetical protein CRN81_19225 [Chromobacterium violaceum]ATP34239.1 hypothetical protein CR207_19255 [Chromobacterium violaceum]KMN49974.1 hypothetical protein VK93_08195 [Chromobacterium violaceum]KMN87034.1 hypothetical protein VL02_05935 [Chromobacterium violaceum]KMN88788.1 hypothetical protein VL04_18605 [Chromobacterium violaceum]
MKKSFATLCLLCLALPSAAGRLLPDGLVMGRLADADGSSIEFVRSDRTLLQRLSALIAAEPQRFALSPGLRVFDEHNRFLLSGQLNGLKGRTIGVAFDQQGSINRIWVLGDDEIEAQKQRQAQIQP